MEQMIMISRVALGFLLIFFGLNGFLELVPMPESSQEASEAIKGLAKSIYILPTVMGLLIFTGSLLLMNRYTAAALIILFPLSFNFMMFHIFLDIAGIFPALVVFLLNAFLMYPEKSKYARLFQAE